jgi:hypothetical protein
MKKKPDPFASREFRAWAKEFRDDTLPKITGSAHMLAIAPVAGEFDVAMATQIAEKLRRIADHVIVADMTTNAGREHVQERLRAWLKQ